MTSNDSITEYEKKSRSFWSDKNPSYQLCAHLNTLLEIYASKQEWEKIIDLSSKAVLHLNDEAKRNRFYYIWICALNENSDGSALFLMGRHLLKMQPLNHDYLSLSFMAFFFSNKKEICQKIIPNILNKNQKNVAYQEESIALFMTDSIKRAEQKKGLYILKRLCNEKQASYFTFRNYLRTLSEKNLLVEMSHTYNLMHTRFPFSSEPYIVAALSAMESKNWKEAIRVLTQILRDNPENTDALLALSQCYEERQEFDKAIQLLQKNKMAFSEFDYDFHYSTGRALKKKVTEKFNLILKKESINHLQKSITLAHFFKLPTINLKKELEELYAIEDSEQNEDLPYAI